MLSKFFYLSFIFAFIFLIGCSSPSPVTPDRTDSESIAGPIEALDSFATSMNQVWMTGTMILSNETGEGEVIIGRDPDWNFNVTSFLATACPGGCFRFKIIGIVGTVLEIELTLENPTAIQVYDVKLIYENLYGKKLLNPTSYTDLFKPMSIRPFTAFATEYANRAFPVGPGAIDKETIFIDFPSSTPATVNYIIVVSYPSNTLDPHEIHHMAQQGTLTPSGGSAEISCIVEDHQADISSVMADTTPLTGGITVLSPDTTIPGRFKATITNSMGAPVGTYTCLMRAQSPNPQNASTYNYIDIAVSHATQWGPIEVVHLSPEDWLSVYPDIAFDSRGKAHIVWMEVQHTGPMAWNENIWYSNNVSGSWSAPIELSDAFQNDNDYIVSPSAIAINSQDHICVVWTQCRFNGDRARLWWNYNSGSGWMGQTQMFNLTMREVQPQLTSDDAFFYLAFNYGHQCGDIMFSRYVPDSSWIAPVPVSDPIDMVYELQMDGRREIVAACRGGIFITWLMWDMNTEGIWRIKIDESWDGGYSWGPDLEVICDDPNIHVWQPSIAMDNTSRLYEVWMVDEPEKEIGGISYDKYTYGSWGVDKVLYGHRGAYFPAIAVMPGGFQHVCFCDLKLIPSPLLYINSTDGDTWSSPFQVSPNEGECESPSIDTWQQSKVGITWKQHMGSYTNDILYREANF